MHAANRALCCLRDLKIKGLRDAPKEHSARLFFHVYGREMVQFHQGERSARKPDVVLVSAVDVHAEHVSDCHYLRITTKKPETNFGWRIVRTVVEFKHRNGSIEAPPARYPCECSGPGAKQLYRSQASVGDNEAEVAFPAASSE